MAIRHGKAGQYGKLEALRRTRRSIGELVTFSAIISLLTGLAIGYTFRPGSVVAGTIVMGCVGAAAYLYWRRIGEPQLDKSMKERMKYQRGGAMRGVCRVVAAGYRR